MVAQAVSMASGYVVAVVLARGLGPEAYGVYGLVISVLLATELIGRLGIPQVTSKLIAEGRFDVRSIERTSLTLTLCIYLGITALFLAAAPFVARSFELEGGTRLLRIAAIDIPFYGMLFATQHVLNGERRFRAESLGISIYGLSKACGVLSLLAIGISVENALVVNALASLLGLAYFVTRLAPGALRPSLRFVGPILRMAVPTSLIVLASQVLANLDLWCLRWMWSGEAETGEPLGGSQLIAAAPDATLGLYVAATNLARLPSVVHFVMTAVLIPSVSRLAAREGPQAVRQVVRQAFRFLLLFLAPACAWLALRSEELMLLVYDEAYVAGAGLQAWLVIRFGLLTTLAMTASSVLLALGKPGVAARALLLTIPVGVLLLMVSIQRLGPLGAALGSVGTMVFATLLLLFALWRAVGSLLEARVLWLSSVGVSVVVGTTQLVEVSPAWLPLDGLACFALVAGVLFLMKGWAPAELASLLGRAPRRPGDEGGG